MNRLYRNKVLICYLSSSFDLNIKYNKRTIYTSFFLSMVAFSILCYAQFYEHDLFVKFSDCNPVEFRKSFYIDECAVHAPITNDPRYFMLVFLAICFLVLAIGLESWVVLWRAIKKHKQFISHIAYEWNFDQERVQKLTEFLDIREQDIKKHVNLNMQIADHRLSSANGLLFANIYLASIFRNWKEFFSLLIVVLVMTIVPPVILFTEILVKGLGILCFFLGNFWPIQALFLLSFLSIQDLNWTTLLIYLALLLLKYPIFIAIDRLLLDTSRLQLYRVLVENLSKEKSNELIKCLEGILPVPEKK